jgi:hypothetical protein
MKPFRLIPEGKRVGRGRPGPPRDGLGFVIKFPVTINQFGLSKMALNLVSNAFKAGNVTMEVIDALTEEVIIEVNYTSQGHNLKSIHKPLFKKMSILSLGNPRRAF